MVGGAVDREELPDGDEAVGDVVAVDAGQGLGHGWVGGGGGGEGFDPLGSDA